MKHVPWKTLSETPAFRERGWDIFCETIEYPDGSQASDCFIHRKPGGALAFALTEEGQLVLNRQYKHGAQEIVAELAIGGLKENDASPLEAAKRELLEETGYGGGAWEPLGVLFPNPTFSRSRVHSFLARGVRKIAEPVKNPREIIEVRLVHLSELPGMIARGEVATEATVAASLLALMKLGILPA